MSARSGIAAYWAGTAALIAVALAVPTWSVAAWVTLSSCAAVAIGVGVVRHRPSRSGPWALLAGALLVSTGVDIRYALAVGGGGLAGQNLLYLGAFLLASAALLRFSRSGSRGPERAGMLDAVTVTLVLLLLLWVAEIGPVGLAAWSRTHPALLGYPIGAALLLATSVRLLTARRRTPAVILVLAGAVAALAADTLGNVTAAPAPGGARGIDDLGWLLTYACWGAAALHPSMTGLTAPEVMGERELTLRRLLVIASTALVPPVILLVEAITGEVRDGFVLALATVALFLLSLTRVAATANSHRRSLVFRERNDTLTGLASRAYLVDRVTAAVASHRDHPVAVMLVDLDDFRLVNDTAGHSVGDEVLAAVSRRLVRHLNRHDLVARFGGDEFAILVGASPPGRDISALAAHLAAVIAEPVTVAGRSVSVSACIGLAIIDAAPERAATAPGGPAPEPGTGEKGGDGAANADAGTPHDAGAGRSRDGAKPRDPLRRRDAAEVVRAGQDLLRQAGLALRAAQEAGPGQWCRYDSDRHGQMVERMRLREALARAVTEGSFQLRYQPIVVLDTGATVGFEALVRWEHPTRGLVAPSEFIALAEETGLIEPIGDLVLRTAVAAAAGWVRTTATEAYVSVNVSARQFRTPGFSERVERVLNSAGLRPALLMLEVTESVLMREDDQVWAELATLRDLGVRLAIDDFGTGFSSLSYLEQTPIDVIKIDKTFVGTLVSSERQRTVVEGVVRMAEKLGLQVVAEGIETEAERNLLAEMRCPYGQGYLYAVPLSDMEAAHSLTAAPPATPAASVSTPTDPTIPGPRRELAAGDNRAGDNRAGDNGETPPGAVDMVPAAPVAPVARGPD